MTEARLELRINRLKRRVARLERGLALLKRWDERKYHPLRAFILEILDEDPDATDEEIAAALVEKADEAMRFEGLRELVTDVGIQLVAEVGLWVHKNRERLVTQRIARLRKRIAALEKQLAKAPARPRGGAKDRPRPAAPDERAIFVELGMSPEFFEAPAPKRKVRARAAATA